MFTGEAVVLVWGIGTCDYYALRSLTQTQRGYLERATAADVGSEAMRLAGFVLGVEEPEKADRKNRAVADAMKHCIPKSHRVLTATSAGEVGPVKIFYTRDLEFYAINNTRSF